MSNYLAIATVTTIIKNILTTAVRSFKTDAIVTSVKPTAEGKGLPTLGVNLFLYQISPNSTTKNAIPRTRNINGVLVKQNYTGIDLYYLITVYGNEETLEPEKLMGVVVSTLVDHIMVTKDTIEATLATTSDEDLADCDLGEQVDKIQLTPLDITTDELSKIWSTLVQAPYTLCRAYQCSIVTIDGAIPGQIPWRVRERIIQTFPAVPTISRVMSGQGSTKPILADSTLVIKGERLKFEGATVKLGERMLTPTKVTRNLVELDLKGVKHRILRAGVYSLQMVYLQPEKNTKKLKQILSSNIVAFVLCPKIVRPIGVERLELNREGLYSGYIRLELDLLVGVNQRVALVLNEIPRKSGLGKSAGYMFSAKPRDMDTNLLVFSITDVLPGDYTVRVQVDGSESVLSVNTDPESSTFGQYLEPKITI